ncbi:cubilin-like [Mya arenaria]|uniref:cubilin-like n=1 Tax=Mya arenaria TaxID=6604 RepID=UPI0022E3BE4F|nr:cubilin-like [Mya arenaria]
MWRILVPVVLVLATVTSFVGAACSNDTFTNKTESWQITKFPDVNGTCTWTINANSSQTLLNFEGLTLDFNIIKLAIYGQATINDTNKQLIIDITNNTGTASVVSTYNVTLVVLTSISGTMTGNITVDYNAANCSYALPGFKGLVKSPLYGNQTTNKTFMCDYKVTKPNDGDLFVLSFTSFNLTNGSNLTVSFGVLAPETFKGSSLPSDQLGETEQNTFNLTLIVNASAPGQNFALLYQTASGKCSGKRGASTTNKTLAFPASTMYPTLCYAQLTAPEKNQLYVQNVGGDAQLAGTDSVVFYDGLSKQSPMLGSLSSGVNVFTTSSGAMTVVADLGIQTGRQRSISYKADSVSKVVTLVKGITQSISVPKAAQALLQFNGNGAMVRVEVTGTLSTSSFVQVQTSKGVPVYNMKSGMAMFPVGVADKTARVVISLFKDDNVTVKATAVDNDCNSVLNATTGQISVTAVPVGNKTSCVTGIISAGTIQMSLTPDLCSTGKLLVYEGMNSNGKVLATLDGSKAYTNVPQIWGNGGFRMEYSDSAACTKNIVKATYMTINPDTVCNVNTKEFRTPNFPNQYPLNANCQWKMAPKNNTMVLISFNSTVQLAGKHSIMVKNSTGQIANFSSTSASLPMDILANNAIGSNNTVLFSSTPNGAGLDSVANGAKLTVMAVDCGGYMNISTGSVEVSAGKTPVKECIWIIQVPAGNNTNPNVINTTISLTGNNKSGRIELHNGGSIRDAEFNRTLANFTRTNFLVVHYVNSSANSTSLLFKLSFKTITCNETCKNGVCLQPGWRCNQRNDCGDWTDEINCPYVPPKPTPAPPTPTPKPRTDEKKGASGGWLFFCIVIGIVVGIILTVAVPRIIRRVRGRGSGARRGYDSMAEDA